MFGGASCLNVPVNAYACDGAHQQIPPIKALGNAYAAVRYRNRVANKEESPPWRLVGAVNDTQLTWLPAKPPGAPDVLALGQIAEFTSPGPFLVRARTLDHPFYLAAYMTGGDHYGGAGDPEWVNVIPTAQYLREYVLFTDPTYPETSLVVVRNKQGRRLRRREPRLRRQPRRLEALGDDQEWTRVDLVTGNFQDVGNCSNGRHEMTSDNPFGVTVWGWGSERQRRLQLGLRLLRLPGRRGDQVDQRRGRAAAMICPSDSHHSGVPTTVGARERPAGRRPRSIRITWRKSQFWPPASRGAAHARCRSTCPKGQITDRGGRTRPRSAGRPRAPQCASSDGAATRVLMGRSTPSSVWPTLIVDDTAGSCIRARCVATRLRSTRGRDGDETDVSSSAQARWLVTTSGAPTTRTRPPPASPATPPATRHRPAPSDVEPGTEPTTSASTDRRHQHQLRHSAPAAPPSNVSSGSDTGCVPTCSPEHDQVLCDDHVVETCAADRYLRRRRLPEPLRLRRRRRCCSARRAATSGPSRPSSTPRPRAPASRSSSPTPAPRRRT
jgi:hypothetical protein